jgi:hypothetical protein
MNYWFITAAVLAALLGVLHSYLGERLVLGPFSQHREIPRLLGSRLAMMRVLRFTWHLTTVLLFGAATITALIARPGEVEPEIASLLALTYLGSSLVALVGSRGRHFSWGVFLVCALCMWVGRP